MKQRQSPFREFAHRSFYDADTREFRTANDILLLVTVVAVVALLLETRELSRSSPLFFRGIEYVSTLIFTVEYGLRIWGAKNPRRYIFSFLGIIDLLAILPTLIGFGGFVALKSVRVLRTLRFLHITQIARMSTKENERDGFS